MDGAPQRPLDTERQRLRKQGYTDAEISQILIAREAGGQQSESPSHGVMTGVASNLAAAGSYVWNFLPGLAANIATAFNPQAPGAARGGAALSFAFKIVVVAVIAYVLAQEFSQLRSTTARAAAEACDARLKVLMDNYGIPLTDAARHTRTAWDDSYDQYKRDCVGSAP